MRIEYDKIASISLAAYCLSFALSIALGQIFLGIFALSVVLWVKETETGKSLGIVGAFKKFISENHTSLEIFYFPCIMWFLVLGLSSLVGLRPQHSFQELFKFAPYFILPFLVFIFLELTTNFKLELFWGVLKRYVLLMFLGQTLAGIHTVISSYLGQEIKLGIPGPLTESGQISLLFPIYLAISYTFIVSDKFQRNRYYLTIILLVVFLSLFSWVGFSPFLARFKFIILLSLLAQFGFLIWSGRKYAGKREGIFLAIFGSFMLVVLLVNLKRGPWMSVVVTALIFSYLLSYRRLLGVLVVVGMACLLPPIWQRLGEFSDHFFIAGGRFDMWKLGFQLIERFPLGIGFSNSDLIREFDPTLPKAHRHMHNNLLNVTLENGILGGIIYLWWFGYFISRIVNKVLESGGSILEKGSFLRLFVFSFAIATLGYQIAGLVEYNFGDGEIRLLFLVLSGFSLASLSVINQKKSVR